MSAVSTWETLISSVRTLCSLGRRAHARVLFVLLCCLMVLPFQQHPQLAAQPFFFFFSKNQAKRVFLFLTLGERRPLFWGQTLPGLSRRPREALILASQRLSNFICEQGLLAGEIDSKPRQGQLPGRDLLEPSAVERDRTRIQAYSQTHQSSNRTEGGGYRIRDKYKNSTSDTNDKEQRMAHES